MHDNRTKSILESLQQGQISVDDALLQLKLEPFQDLGYAKVDHHRRLRQGVPEVIYGAGKTPEQMVYCVGHGRGRAGDGAHHPIVPGGCGDCGQNPSSDLP